MCFLTLFANRLNNFQNFGGSILPLGFNAQWGFLTRAPLGYFYNACQLGGAISSPPSDLRKIRRARSFKNFQTGFERPGKTVEVENWIFACSGSRVNRSELSFGVLLTVFAKRLRSKKTFKILGVDFNPRIHCQVGFLQPDLSAFQGFAICGIFRNIVGALIVQFFENFLTPTNQ